VGSKTYTAIRLYTAAGGRLLGEDHSVGILAPGAFADVVGFRTDLVDCPVDDLPSQQPALTLVGGRPVHDPDGLDFRPDDQEAEVERFVRAGARHVDIGQGVPTWVVRADPEGNEFCAVETRKAYPGGVL
jgi:hypothetical protein